MKLETTGLETGAGARNYGRTMVSASQFDGSFAEEWNALDKQHRRQIRRLVRIGREQENVEDARLAVGFAAYQRSRAWYRFFWLWFPVLIAAGIIAGFSLHPIVLGMVLAIAGNALLVRRAFKRAEWVNGRLLGDA